MNQGFGIFQWGGLDSERSKSPKGFVPELVVVSFCSHYRPVGRYDHNVISLGFEGDCCDEAQLCGILIEVKVGASPAAPNNYKLATHSVFLVGGLEHMSISDLDVLVIKVSTNER